MRTRMRMMSSRTLWRIVNPWIARGCFYKFSTRYAIIRSPILEWTVTVSERVISSLLSCCQQIETIDIILGLFQVSIAHGINDPYRYEKTSHGNTVVCDYRFHIQGRFHGPYREYCLGMLMLPRNKSDTNICMFRKASMGRLFASSRLSMYSGSRII